jgi:NhaP-type Na+/H+ or K+/H+ antiporter
MEREIHEQYEYARRRLKQKKRLYYHFVLLLIGSLFLYVSSEIFETDFNPNWYIWAITIWIFLFVLHFIKIYITDRFMNKNWEREQIDRLVGLQQKKLAELQNEITEDTTKQA